MTWYGEINPSRLQVSVNSEVFKDPLAVGQFLRHATRGGNHRQSTVLKLFRLHIFESRWILRSEAEGVEPDVSRRVIRPQLSWSVVLDIFWVNPAGVETFGFRRTDPDGQQNPKEIGNLLEMGDRWSADVGIKQKGRTFNILSSQETCCGISN